MKIAIHQRKNSSSSFWIDYCEKNRIDYKIVNCYDTDIVGHLEDCDALMWHHFHESGKDIQFAKQLLYSLECSGKLVYPDFRSNWHFDDKLGQKYLFEAIDAPAVQSYAFYTKKEAMEWACKTSFPKVFKLRGGSSSDNVKLVKTLSHANSLIRKAFGRGFTIYNAWGSLKERWRLYRGGKEKLSKVFVGIARFFFPTYYSRIRGRERGYVYFQDFIPDNTFDIRVTFINNKCFASKRMVRPGDFRASGSGISDWDMSAIPEKALQIAFNVSKKLKLQSAAFDFVLFNDEPLIVEMCYGFGYHEDQFKLGYWDEELNFYPGPFDPYGWMVEGVIKELNSRSKS